MFVKKIPLFADLLSQAAIELTNIIQQVDSSSNLVLMKDLSKARFYAERVVKIVDPPYGINAPNMNMGSGRGYISTSERLRKGRLNSGGGKLKDRALHKMAIEWDYKAPSPRYFKELFRVSKNQIIFGGNYSNEKRSINTAKIILKWRD